MLLILNKYFWILVCTGTGQNGERERARTGAQNGKLRFPEHLMERGRTENENGERLEKRKFFYMNIFGFQNGKNRPVERENMGRGGAERI